MTKKDFFILIIKLFGLFSIVTSLASYLPNNIVYGLMDMDAFTFAWISAVVLIVIGLFVLLIFKSHKIVELLKLEKGFDDDKIDLGNLKPIDILKIGTFIIGGLLIIDNIPTFLSHSYFALKDSMISKDYGEKDSFYWGVSGLNLIIGYILISNYDYVAKLLRKTTSENK